MKRVKRLTTVDVDVALEAVAYLASNGDYEAAHAKEDDLLWDAIYTVSLYRGPFQKFAKEVLRSRRIKFTRYTS